MAEVRRAIYALDGNNLKIRINPDEHSKDQPTEFTTTRRSKFLLFAFEHAHRRK
jgi:hypothetical protein